MFDLAFITALYRGGVIFHDLVMYTENKGCHMSYNPPWKVSDLA